MEVQTYFACKLFELVFFFQSEIQRVLDLKVSPTRIIYANPCKQSSHIKFAAKNNVSMMTFDNEAELHKIKAVYPTARQVQIIFIYSAKSICYQHISRVAKIIR